MPGAPEEEETGAPEETGAAPLSPREDSGDSGDPELGWVMLGFCSGRDPHPTLPVEELPGSGEFRCLVPRQHHDLERV